jgi:hypothetical protein
MAQRVPFIVAELQARGASTTRAIAAALNARGIRTARARLCIANTGNHRKPRRIFERHPDDPLI